MSYCNIKGCALCSRMAYLAERAKEDADRVSKNSKPKETKR